MARLKVLRPTALTSDSQSTRAGLRTEVADRGAWTTSSLASDDDDDEHRHEERYLSMGFWEFDSSIGGWF